MKSLLPEVKRKQKDKYLDLIRELKKGLLCSLHNRLTLIHKYTSTGASEGADQTPVLGAPLQLLGHTSAGRISVTRIWQCVAYHWWSLWPQGASPLALTLFRGISLIAWRLRNPFSGEYWQGPMYFWKCRARVGSGPVPGPTVKRPCTILIQMVGMLTNAADLTYVTQSRVIPLALWTDSRYPIELSASY